MDLTTTYLGVSWLKQYGQNARIAHPARRTHRHRRPRFRPPALVVSARQSNAHNFSSKAEALKLSVILTLLALLVFGYVKGRFTGSRPWRSAAHTALVGGLAAAVAFGIAKAIG